MKKKIGNFFIKLIMMIFVVILVWGIIVLFTKVFAFEPDQIEAENNYNETDELVQELYEYLDGFSNNLSNTMYNGNYNKYGTISAEVVMSISYNHLQKYYKDKLQPCTKEGCLYSFREADLLDAAKKVFGSDVKIYADNFRINNDKKAIYEEEEKKFYVNSFSEEIKYEVYREIESYVIDTEDNIYIYDYYLKCDIANNICYDNSNLKNVNTSYKIVDGNINVNNKDNLKKYRHTFKKENDAYYWVSTESDLSD